MSRSISFTAVRHGRSLEIVGGHRAILSTSVAWAISNASRPVRIASARTPRLTDAACQHRRIGVGGRSCNVTGIDFVHIAAVENDPSTEPRPKRVRLVDEPERLGESRTDDRRQLNRYEQQVHGQQRRARERGDMGRSIHNHAIDVTSDVRRVAVKRVARETNGSEAPRQPFLCPHLGPLKRAALRVSIDYGDVLGLVGPDSGGVQRQRPLADPMPLVEERDDHGSRS